MATPRISETKRAAIERLGRAGKTLTDIRRATRSTWETVVRVLESAGIPYNHSRACSVYREAEKLIVPVRELIDRAYGTFDPSVVAAPDGVYGVIDDLHEPFSDGDCLRAALASFRARKVRAIITAEVADFSGFSAFGPEFQTSTDSEARHAGDRLGEMADAAPVYLLRSNHGDRLIKMLRRLALNVDQAETSIDAVRRWLAAPERLGRNRVRALHTRTGHIQFGAAIYAHGDKFLKMLGNSPREMAKKLFCQAQVHNVRLPVDLLGVGHEHRYFDGTPEGYQMRTWVVPGCCYWPFYASKSKPSGYNTYSQVCGWGEVVLRGGRVVLPESRLVFYGYARLPEGVQP